MFLRLPPDATIPTAMDQVCMLDASPPSSADRQSSGAFQRSVADNGAQAPLDETGSMPELMPCHASMPATNTSPPTLIFTSSEDPLLDDSVAFNGRLRSVGVKSRLRAVPDMPHAFWALSTAGSKYGGVLLLSLLIIS